ncbi:hypothetical protein RM780_12060 [Streptomyces sp. DSM 44917]|uniref:Lipoprotein n=1 Tax=Streptomyces boetiae TaxID=3075541 RepID=A0ABU2L868_9ACTN|nr:hypothetical protein [Streptomyces sp. DSM 44917]MDT0307692.1 hypothetical protein [Streptomyces sp. DSM 44917]
MIRTAPATRVRRSRWRRAAASLACAGLLALTSAACSSPEDPDEGTNGVGELPPEEIAERARRAAASAETVRLSGTVLTQGVTYELDVRLGTEGAAGQVSAEGTTFELLRIGEELYIRADAAFWEAAELPEELETDPAETLEGRYVRVPPEDPAYAEFSGFTDKNTLLDGLLSLQGELEAGDRGEREGVRTIRVEGDEGTGGAMEVALIGEPYPLRLERGGDAGTVTLNAWGEEFPLTPPDEEQIVDYGEEVISPE